MRKDIVRREAIKLKLYKKKWENIQRLLQEKYNYSVSKKTLKRWYKRFNEGNWNFRDLSRKPITIHYKFTQDDIDEVISLRENTGFSSYQMKIKLNKEKGIFISESTIKGIIRNTGLSRGNKMEGKRLKWIRFQREHPNSMWQIDGTEDEFGNWIVPIIDDCSRYCVAIGYFKENTTKNTIRLLEEASEMHGKPREILTDNGQEFGGTSKDSEFDKWCKKQDILHIRSGIHKPTTVGKVSRIQFTIACELPYCKKDLEYFRYRYNCERPHRSLNGKRPNQVYLAFHKLF